MSSSKPIQHRYRSMIFVLGLSGIISSMAYVWLKFDCQKRSAGLWYAFWPALDQLLPNLAVGLITAWISVVFIDRIIADRDRREREARWMPLAELSTLRAAAFLGEFCSIDLFDHPRDMVYEIGTQAVLGMPDIQRIRRSTYSMDVLQVIEKWITTHEYVDVVEKDSSTQALGAIKSKLDRLVQEADSLLAKTGVLDDSEFATAVDTFANEVKQISKCLNSCDLKRVKEMQILISNHATKAGLSLATLIDARKTRSLTSEEHIQEIYSKIEVLRRRQSERPA